jgi:hypothetical protein
MSSTNPVTRRLDQLRLQWKDFAAKPEGRVLCWQLESDEYSMVNAMVAAEDDARAGKLADVFVPLAAPFVPGKYGEGLLKEFCEKAEALHTGLEDDSVPKWQPPPAASGSGAGEVALWKACGSFIEHYKLPKLLALVLMPSKADDVAAFRQWLDTAARAALPGIPKLRLVVLDDVRSPSLAELARAQPERVVALPAELDMAGARLEVSEDAGNLDTPGGQFRHQFVQMTNALGAQDMATAEKHSQAALAIAKAQGWHALAVPIHLAMGASLAAAKQFEPAGKRYLDAEAAAAAGEKAGDASCPKLRVQVRLCRGSLLILQQAWKAAALLFTETRPMAEALKEPGMVVDCYRLASFSMEQDKQLLPAWQHGVDGVAYAKTQEKETLASTTLSYLGVGLSRIGKQKEYASSWQRVERDMVALLGPDWRPAEAPPEEAPAAAPKGGARA